MSAQGPEAGPRRVISLIPSVTDLIVAIGAGDRLVARTVYDNNPAVAHLPSIGGTVDPSLERLAGLRPDLVFVWREPRNAALDAFLEGAGIRAQPLGTETLAELRGTLDRIGELLALPERSDSLGRAIDDTLAAVRRRMASRGPTRVLYLLDLDPLLTTGGGTFLDDLIRAAGGRNIFGDVTVKWPGVSVEAVVEHNPDVIVWPRPGGASAAIADLRRRPGWRDLPAVITGRVLVVDRDLFNRPGPEIGTAARRLAEGFLRLDRRATTPVGGAQGGY